MSYRPAPAGFPQRRKAPSSPLRSPRCTPFSYLTNGGNEYSYGVHLAVWQTDAVAKNPLVIGYVVEGTGSGVAPKSLPRYPLAYSANETSIIWAWSNDTTRPAQAYGVALPTSTGGWTVPADNVKGVDTGRFWIETGLAAGQTRQVRFQSYDSMSQDNPSALGPAIAGTTIGDDVPVLTRAGHRAWSPETQSSFP